MATLFLKTPDIQQYFTALPHSDRHGARRRDTKFLCSAARQVNDQVMQRTGDLRAVDDALADGAAAMWAAVFQGEDLIVLSPEDRDPATR